MVIYPAIDIKEGQCVRLLQGKEEEATVYGRDPAAMAEKWIAAGAEYVHVVDLDGAFAGTGKNGEAIRAILHVAKGIPVQLGGGIRSLQDIEMRLSWGVERVIVGSAAISNPQMIREAAKAFPNRVVAGIDAKDGQAAIHGWVDVSDISAIDLAKRLYDVGIQTCVYTDISRDGMLTGANVEATTQLKNESGMDVIASGGIGSLADIAAIRQANIGGAIVGKALYEGKFTLEACLAEANRTER
jgi:phosphoribosylformimino-5-aminoimidazole carboxamide ribotide isomerase